MLNATRAYELNVLVNNRPVTEFDSQGNIFIEGRKGSDFELEFKNKSSKQVLIVPSVDGKSVLDGKRATPESRGYIVSAWGSIRIPGWTLDNNSVAKFTFDDKEKSYSAAIAEPGEEVITGVIGVLVYSEKAKPAPVHHIHHYPAPTPRIDPFGPTAYPYSDPTWTTTSLGSADNASYSKGTKGVLRGMGAQAQTANTATLSASASTVSNPAPADNPLEMGTAFGAKSDFKTHNVSFERDAIVATMQLYYDSRKNLEARGIQFPRREVADATLPQAFSGVGCPTPPGWKG